LTTSQSASLAVRGKAKRGNINAALEAPPHCGEEAPAFRPGSSMGNFSHRASTRFAGDQGGNGR